MTNMRANLCMAVAHHLHHNKRIISYCHHSLKILAIEILRVIYQEMNMMEKILMIN